MVRIYIIEYILYNIYMCVCVCVCVFVSGGNFHSSYIIGMNVCGSAYENVCYGSELS